MIKRIINLQVGDPSNDGHGRYSVTKIEISKDQLPTNEEWINVFGGTWEMIFSDDILHISALNRVSSIINYHYSEDDMSDICEELLVDIWLKCVNHIDRDLNANYYDENIPTSNVCLGGYELYMN